MKEPIALSVSDSVQASGLGKTTLYEAMADGRLETRKVGRKRLILFRSLRAFIEGEAE
jgi:excisionase family DNA binding protein